MATVDNVETNIITLSLDEDKSYIIWGYLIARNTTTNGETASYHITQSTAYRDTGGNAVLIGADITSPIILTSQNSGGGSVDWEVNMLPDNTSISIEVTGDATDRIEWVAHIHFAEVSG